MSPIGELIVRLLPVIILIYLCYKFYYKDDKDSAERFNRVMIFEAKNANNHRLTFNCQCDECVKKT